MLIHIMTSEIIYKILAAGRGRARAPSRRETPTLLEGTVVY